MAKLDPQVESSEKVDVVVKKEEKPKKSTDCSCNPPKRDIYCPIHA